MQRYLVTAPLHLHAGAMLELTPEQAAPRVAARALAPMPSDGVYEVRTSVQFKAGELIGYAGLVPKTLAAALSSPDAPAAAEPAAAEPAAPPPAAAAAKTATRKPAPRASAPAAE